MKREVNKVGFPFSVSLSLSLSVFNISVISNFYSELESYLFLPLLN